MTGRKLLVLYVPSLDRRLIAAEAAPFLNECIGRAVELETHPSVELLPTLATGVWPHEHQIWQVRLKRAARRDGLARAIDWLPDSWTTALQCVWHRFDKGYDLPTIEPRRRRRFEIHRIKVQRRHGGGGIEEVHRDGLHSLFSLLGAESRYRTIFSFDAIPEPADALVQGDVALDFLELYAFDLFCHWNLDRMEAVRDKLRQLDRVIEQLSRKAERLGLGVLLVVDHGQERVRHTIDLRRVLAGSGVPRDEFLFYIEVCNARFWYFSDRARTVLPRLLSELRGATYLTNEDMGRYHVHFDSSQGFGDAYLISDPGTIFFPHDFYHPLVNWYMARNTREQEARKSSPVHRGYHGHLPGPPADIGYMTAITSGLERATDRGELIDFAPTVLRLLGRETPEQMRGTALFFDRRNQACQGQPVGAHRRS